METILVVAAVFVLSLTAAVVLFRFFRSTALIKQKTYQAGGALGGFIIIYALLFGSYYRTEQRYQNERERNQVLTEANDDLGKQVKKLELAVISGVVQPDKGPVKVRLVLDAQEPDSAQGRFQFQVPRVLLENPTMALYAITDDEHVLLDANCTGDHCQLPESSIYLFGQANYDDVKIPVKLKRR
jgi:hypothetical protein